ncbi:MAG: NAD(P)H-dependent oxidoreductase [Limisphaerales bacterium]|jgi:NAD(P)H dehydrogenase (quinone)|nr:NAD(P)H-dependent oxidoreductase [Verrucomicrobiota bacterium]
MNISIILAHPNPESYTHALAHAAREAIQAQGHIPWLHDLYAENFDPVTPLAELARDPGPLPPLVQQHIEEITRADGIIIVHPNWWSDPPAILAGWRDRCLRAGLAYRFEPDGKGGGRSVGMLAARFALILNTQNTPLHIEEEILRNPMRWHWQQVVFGLCGVKDCTQQLIGPVITSTPEQRAQWLAQSAEWITQKLKSLSEEPQP